MRTIRHSIKKYWIGQIAFIFLLLSSLLPVYTAAIYPENLNDDSFITLTFAKNLSLGNGFVYNHAPEVLGTTTPLYTLLVAFTHGLFPSTDLPSVAVFFSALCWLGIGWLFFVFRKAWGITGWQAAIIGIVIYWSPWVFSLGMEAYVFAFVLVLCLSFFWSEWYFAAGVTAGFLHLVRGEGGLIVGILGALLLVKALLKKGSPIKVRFMPLICLVAGFVIPVGIWMAYAYPTFGDFLPNTLAAKRAQGANLYGRPFLVRLIQEWIPSWEKRFSVGGVSWLNIWWILSALGIFAIIRRYKKFIVLFAWLGLYIAGYVLLKVSAYYWYQLPVLFVMYIFFSIGIIEVMRFLLGLRARSWLKIIAVVIFAAFILSRLVLPSIQSVRTFQGDNRGPSYRGLSTWFNENSDPKESIGYIEIGYLGYFTSNRIVDLAGLINPEAAEHISNSDYSWAFWDEKPDYYVYLPDFDWALSDIINDPRFEKEYESVAVLPGPRETDFTIFKRIQ